MQPVKSAQLVKAEPFESRNQSIPSKLPLGSIPTTIREMNLSPKDQHSTFTGKPLKAAAESVVLFPQICSPRHSFLLTGLVMMMDGRGDYASISQGIGFITFLAGIPFLVIKPIAAVSGTLVGVVGTAVLAPAYAVEKTARIFISFFRGSSETDEEHRRYMDKFVKRMVKSLNEYPNYKKNEFIDDPEVLISLAITGIAFLSRDLEGDSLKIQGKTVSIDELPNSNDIRNYFLKFCEIKSYIQDLELSRNDNEAWQRFLNTVNTFYLGEDLPEDQAGPLDVLIQKNEELTGMIIQDPVFQQAWRERPRS